MNGRSPGGRAAHWPWPVGDDSDTLAPQRSTVSTRPGALQSDHELDDWAVRFFVPVQREVRHLRDHDEATASTLTKLLSELANQAKQAEEEAPKPDRGDKGAAHKWPATYRWVLVGDRFLARPASQCFHPELFKELGESPEAGLAGTLTIENDWLVTYVIYYGLQRRDSEGVLRSAIERHIRDFAIDRGALPEVTVSKERVPLGRSTSLGS